MSPHWALASPERLRDHHFMALRLLRSGHHTMDDIEDENEFAAAIVFEQLVNGGWARKLKVVGASGNSYALTDTGSAALTEQSS